MRRRMELPMWIKWAIVALEIGVIAAVVYIIIWLLQVAGLV